MLYAADTFLTPVRTLPGHKRKHGSVGHIKKLAAVQRQAALVMGGALRSSPTDTLEAHALLLPMDLLVDKICHRAAVRLCALPDSHPLSPHVRRAGRRLIKRHRSSIHEILDASRPFLDFKHTEKINPARLHPRWRPLHRTHIPDDRDAAIADDPRWARHAYRVYTDGSAIDGGVGAAAILYAPRSSTPKILRLHLGPSTRHTVYEAEVVATILGLELLRAESACRSDASIALDNMAAIQASTSRAPGPGRYLTDIFHRNLRTLKAERSGLALTLRWVPGHCDIAGNEAADAAAKEAAGGASSPRDQLPKELRKSLPMSTTRARGTFKAELDRRAAERWRTSERGRRMAEIDKSLPSKKYGQLIAGLSRRHANLLLQLRTNHVPLQSYLARIGKTPTPTCPTCREAPETVAHYLFACPTYSLHRAVHFRPLGHSGRTLANVLNKTDALTPLFNYINATGRFRGIYGSLNDPLPEDSAT